MEARPEPRKKRAIKRKRLISSSDELEESSSVKIPPKRGKEVVPTFNLKGNQLHIAPGPTSRKQKKYGDITNAEVGGTVEQVHLTNFMCHDNILLDFNRHLNFITGSNGSGKSSVLAGLVLGLGGTGSSMKRGNGVNDYIKKDKNSSTITVTLVNAGPDAYKTEIYGQRIIVQRTMIRSGSSKYIIMDENERTVNTTYSELASIKERLDIMIGNPISIVNQEVSRVFLSECNPEKLFQLFIIGTKLKQMASDISHLQMHQRNSNIKLNFKKTSLNRLESEIERLEEKEQEHRTVMEGKAKLSKLALQAKYAKLKKMEDERTNLIIAIEEGHKEVFRLKGRISEQKENLKVNQSERDKKELEVSNIGHRTEEIKTEIQEAKAQLRDCNEQRDNVELVLNEREENIRRKETEIIVLKKHIQKLYSMEDRSGIITKLRDDIEIENGRLHSERTNITNMQINLNNFKCEIGNLTDRLNEAKLDLSNNERELLDLMSNKSRLNTRSAGAFGAYSKADKQLNDLIKQNSLQFHKVPKGPLGMYIKLKDPKYGVAVEKCLGFEMLKRYFCDNHKDAEKFKALRDSVFNNIERKPAYTVSRFLGAVHNVGGRVPECDYPTVMDVVDVCDADVTNCLIDCKHIESTIIIPKSTLQHQLIHTMRFNPPRKATIAYDYEGNNATPKPNYRCFMNKSINPVCKLLGTSATERIKQLDESIREVQAKIDHIKPVVHKLSNKIHTLKIEQKKLEDDDIRSRAGVEQLERAIKLLTEGLADKEKELGQDAGIFRANIVEIEMDMNQLKMELETISVHMNDLKLSVEQAKSNIKGLKEKLNLMLTSALPLETEYNDLIYEKERLRKKIDGNENTLRELETNQLPGKQIELADFNEGVLAFETVFKSLLAEGDSVSDYETKFTWEKLIQMFLKLEAELGRSNEQFIDIRRVLQDLQQKRDALKNCQKNLTELKDLNKKFHVAIAKRKEMYKRVKGYMCFRLRVSFIHNMIVRQYKGDLHINFRLGVINISADMTKTDHHQSSSCNTRSSSNAVDLLMGLSGGERSFTTVCFLLSLWECVEAPFRCVDEFDVFMDLVNRNTSLSMLVEFARGVPGVRSSKQFIILSPLDPSLPINDESVTVLRMDDPRK